MFSQVCVHLATFSDLKNLVNEPAVLEDHFRK